MEVMATTQIYKNNQTAIPKAIRKQIKEYDKNNIVLDWSINPDGEIRIRPRKKRTITDLKGLIKLDHPTDSVELKKELYLYD